ncbi:unannotated protein [freshwater metagenome]|uniref:Unannotated protein n=1 Tax=freshwater metagenome TaxID=449393 RepID=A0A6J6EI08_9ZZZZ
MSCCKCANKIRILEGCCAKDDAGNSSVEQCIGRFFAPNTATSLNRHVDRIADRSDDFAIERRARACRVEIYDVDPTCTCVGENLGLCNGIAVVDGFARIVALIQTHCLTVQQINRGIQLHQFPTFRRAASTKPRRSSSPTVPDFSGWNCVAHNPSRSTAAATGPP